MSQEYIFWNSYSVSNNVWSDNESKTFEILMETICSDLALSLHAPGGFYLGFYLHQQKEEINCFLGDCILLIWCPWLMMLRFQFPPIHAPQMCAHCQFT